MCFTSTSDNIFLFLFFWIFRYHYNVADSRLQQHVEKGNEDGLYISCVASAANLWALIMDAGTGFSSQVYDLSSVFLHKVIPFISSVISALLCVVCIHTADYLLDFCQDWIMEQWEKNFYISSIAGAANGSSLVVMSKGWILKQHFSCLLAIMHHKHT